MLQRTITSVVILIIALLVVALSDYVIYPIAVMLLSVAAVYEILKVMKIHRHPALAIPAYICAAAFPVMAYFVTTATNLGFILIIAAAMFVYMLYLMGVSIFSKGKLSFSSMCEAFVAVTYVVVSFTSLSLLRYLNPAVGVLQVVLVFLVAWVCDVFAYLVGSAIGKHKLIPEISPKKTVEGALGGVVFTALFCLLYGFAVDKIFDKIDVNYVVLAACGIILPVVAQLGDLVASAIKREYGAKDYGRIFPGHGGVMDRFDSVLAVSTALMILCVIIPPFTAI
jgi:phosphatidate cytidylyltransferase